MKRALAQELTAVARQQRCRSRRHTDRRPLRRGFPAFDVLAKKRTNGVASGPVAANNAARDWYSRPAPSKPAVRDYWTNNANSDRDKDGTACEN